MAVTTWNTAPNYDEWGFDSYWNCQDWIQYHQQLKKKFGKEKANYIWNYAYAQGSEFSSHWNCRTTNVKFREYVRKNGLDPYAGVTLPLAPQVLNLFGSGLETISGLGDFVGSIGKNIKTLGWIALGGVVVFAGISIYKEVKK